MEKAVIIGAGITGAVIAYELKKAGYNVTVYEKREHIGGNCYIEDIDGIKVHKYGAHIFNTSDDEIWDFVNEFEKPNNFINSPIANYKGKLYNLPLNMNTVYQITGKKKPSKVVEKKRKKEYKNLEEFAIGEVGKKIYKTIIKDYTEKQWGKRCKDLPADIMRRIPIRTTFDNNYYKTKYQGVFDYTEFIKKLLCGCEIIKKKVELKELKTNNQLIIYTGALDELFDYCYGELEWRSLRFEHETVAENNYQGVAVMNFTDKTPYTRKIEHKHFLLGDDLPYSIITREYPQKWERGKEKYYPINTPQNEEINNRYLKLAKDKGIIVAGRLGKYKYISMDEAIKDARNVAKSIIKRSEMNGE